MAISRRKFWLAAGLLAAAVLPVTLGRMAVVAHRDKARDVARGKWSRSKAMEDIAEAVFRYQLKHHEALQWVEVVFLELDAFPLVDSRNPCEEFMERFADHKLPVKPGSAAGIEGDEGGVVIDKETGKEGVILSIWVCETIWNSSREVEVWGEYTLAGLTAAGYIYTVKLKDGKWVVVGARLLFLA